MSGLRYEPPSSGLSGGGSGDVPDADATTKGIVQLAGDLGGTAAAPTVPGLASKADSAATTTALAAKAPLASPALTGNPTAPTPAQGDNDTSIATTAYVQTEVGLLIPKSLVDAKGDLLVGSADNTVIRKAVGTDGQVLTADSGSAGGVKWTTRVAEMPRIAVGRYSALSPVGYDTASTLGVYSLTLNKPQAAPFTIADLLSIDRIGIEVTSAAATSVVRIGIFTDAAGVPASLVFDAGTIDASTTGFKEITISQQLAPGRYWAVACAQVAACTVRAGLGDLASWDSGLTASQYVIGSIQGPTTTGAFGSTFGTVANGGGAMPRVVVRGA